MQTLSQFIIEKQEELTGATGAFSRLLHDLSIAAKMVHYYVNRAGILDIFGATGNINVQGEVQQKLDILAHEEFLKALQKGGECCLVGSEEHAEAIPLKIKDQDGKYIVLIDPLDGSSNIDVNVSVGTIFSIYKLPEGTKQAGLKHALQAGHQQVAAGYVIYGSSTVLVYTAGKGVNGFTLDNNIGEFILSHPNIQTHQTGRIYSINEGNYNSWELGLKNYIKWVQEEDEQTHRPYTARYIGSFVADFHRNLLKGGIYIYPADHRNKNGKLRLMYEANPLAFLIEQAGGKATTGKMRILDIVPQKLHERVPVFIGAVDMVNQAEKCLQESENG